METPDFSFRTRTMTREIWNGGEIEQRADGYHAFFDGSWLGNFASLTAARDAIDTAKSNLQSELRRAEEEVALRRELETAAELFLADEDVIEADRELRHREQEALRREQEARRRAEREEAKRMQERANGQSLGPSL